LPRSFLFFFSLRELPIHTILGTRTAHLKRLANDAKQPNNALHARTELDVLELATHGDDPKAIRGACQDLRICLSLAEGLGTYPARQYIDLVTELGS
jgi:hypothetical protein